jgi:hypothetical protein
MKCQYCGLDNRANFVVCANCGRKRVIDLSGGAPTVVAPKRAGTSATQPPATAAGTATTGFARDATRYLCAAVQMDPALNDKAIRGILDEEYRAIASSPGVDLVTVLKYGLAARRRHLTRDAVLAVLAVISVVIVLESLSAESLGGLEWLVLLFFAAWGVVLVEALVVHYGMLAAHLRRDVFDPAKAPTPASSRVAQRLADIGNQDRGNVTVFARYAPFAGYGTTIDSWSFSLNLAKAEEGKTVIPFTGHELHDFVAGAVKKIGLPGVVVEDRLFVSGLDLQHGFEPAVKSAILPKELAAPVSRVDDAVLTKLRGDPKSRARPYLTVRVGGWSGELVVTTFLRFALLPQQDLLFVEANHSLLPPVRQRYQAMDRLLGKPTARQVFRLAGESLGRVVPAAFGALSRVITAPQAALRRSAKLRRQAREISQDRTFNYGATTSLREEAADRRYHRYFQQLDKEMYTKLVERRVMDALTEFMKAHNIDTSDLAQQQTVIMNHGIYVTGQGRVDANSLAAGPNAIARTFNRAAQGMAPTNNQG